MGVTLDPEMSLWLACEWLHTLTSIMTDAMRKSALEQT